MKTLIFIACFIGFLTKANAQILIEDLKGDLIAENSSVFQNAAKNKFSFIKFNTGDQSLGLTYTFNTALLDPSNYKIHEFSIKARPTEGYANVFNNGQFSPGIKLNYSYIKVPLVISTINYTDWFTLNVGSEINKYNLFKKDTTIKYQIYDQNFKAFSLSLKYSGLIKSTYIFSVSLGYKRGNNYDDLSTIEVKDLLTFFDSTSNTTRQISKSKTAKEGTYTESDTYPLLFSFTKVTKSDVGAAANNIRIGYTIFFKTLCSKDLPKTSTGVNIFFTKQEKNGIRLPTFGIIFQANDPFDVLRKNNGLQNRLSIGFSTAFAL